MFHPLGFHVCTAVLTPSSSWPTERVDETGKCPSFIWLSREPGPDLVVRGWGQDGGFLSSQLCIGEVRVYGRERLGTS